MELVINRFYVCFIIKPNPLFMKNLLLKTRVSILAVLLLMLVQIAFSQVQPPENLSGEDLKSWLITNYYDGKHQTLGYTTARRYLYNYIS